MVDHHDRAPVAAKVQAAFAAVRAKAANHLKGLGTKVTGHEPEQCYVINADSEGCTYALLAPIGKGDD